MRAPASRPSARGLAFSALLAVGAVGDAALPVPAQALVAAALLAGLGLAGLRFARALLPGEDRATTAVAALTLVSAGWTVVGTALGHFGALTLRNALVAAALATFASAWSNPEPAPRAGQVEGLGAAERALLAATLAFFAASLLLEVVRQLDAAPGAQGYDDTSYHLSAVATWLQWGDLRMVKFPVGDGSTAFYPVAGELFSYLLLAPLGGVDVLARWSELPFALGAVAAIVAIGRQLSLHDGATATAAALYAAIPRVFPAGALGAGNDHAMAFFLLGSAAFALTLRRRPARGAWALLGCAAGLVVGTKYSGPMLLPGLLALAAAAALAGLRASRGEPLGPRLRSAAFGALASAATAASVGGYAYLRNAMTAGNPVFPATVSVFGRRLFQGWAGDTLAGSGVRGRSDIDPLGFLWDRVELLGPLFRGTLLPAVLLAFPLALLFVAAPRLRGRGARIDRADALVEAVVLGAPAAQYLAFVFLMADHRDVRYVYGALALSAVSLAWLLERLPPALGSWLRPALLLATLASLATARWRAAGARGLLAAAAVAALLVLGALLFIPRLRAARARLPRSALAAAAVAALVLAAAGGATVNRYLAHRLDAHPAAAFLDRTAPPGSTVAFCGGNQPYLFFGSRLQNRLLYVPTWDGPPGPRESPAPLGASFYAWRGPLPFPHAAADRRAWLRNLEALGAGYVVVVRAGEELPERDWIAARPDAFRRLRKDRRHEIFSFVPAGPDEARLVLRFDRPETDYLLAGDWVAPDPDGPAPRAVRLGSGRGVVEVPPLDAVADRATIVLEGDGAAARPFVVELNGRALRSAGGSGPRIAFEVPPGEWRAGRNSIAVVPDPAAGGAEIRVAALELSLSSREAPARPASGELPGNVDRPEEGSVVTGGALVVAGWCRERGGGRIDPVRFLVDGKEAPPVRLERTDRPDVTAALPYVVEARGTGFAAVLDLKGLPPGRHVLAVEVETPDGRRRTFAGRAFSTR